jgi:serine/threonine-protein kinase
MDTATPPDRIGRYEVVRLLGQGGMGRVFLARDTVLGRHVAVKVLRDDLGLPPESRAALFARMRQEARAAATIEHPHLVTLHDMGEEAPHGLFLVFEYVSGPTLRDRIGEGPLDLGAVARLARELGDALSVAHQAGVIHRDVKPENVIVSPYGAKLTDFGIARLPDSTLTTAGSVLGTPAYSSPEALALADFSPLSDQFSLAVTLFEAISGKRAYPGDDALTIASRIATEPPPALPLSSGEPRLVSRLDAVLGRAMAKEPQKRFPTCRAFGDALANAIEARIIETPRFDSVPPKSIVPRATRRLQNFIAAGALFVIIGLLLLGRQGDREGVSLRRVAESFASASAAAPAHVPLPLPPPPPNHTRKPGAPNDAGRADAPDAATTRPWPGPALDALDAPDARAEGPGAPPAPSSVVNDQ